MKPLLWQRCVSRDPPRIDLPKRMGCFAVEAGKFREIADELHDERALLRSEAAARTAGYPAIPAPAVCTRTTALQVPALSTVNSPQDGVDPSQMRHAGHEWHIKTPLFAGRVYDVTLLRITGDEFKRSRTGGTLRFVTAEREFSSGGELAVLERMTTVVIEKPSTRAESPAAETGLGGPVAIDGPQRKRELRALAGDWPHATPGTRLTEAAIGPLGLTDIVRFAGAIGDFTPIHHDTAMARSFGLEDVIALGTRPTGLALSLFEEGYGLWALKSARLRFHEPLYVRRGIVITIDAAADNRAEAPSAMLDVRDSEGVPILSGTVRANEAR